MIYARNRQTSPAVTAEQLHGGLIVDYEPGDMTSYQLMLVERHGGYRYFTCLNIGPRRDRRRESGWTVHLPTHLADVEWWIEHGLPRGAWPALRPVLAALDAAPGPVTYEPAADVPDEAAASTAAVHRS